MLFDDRQGRTLATGDDPIARVDDGGLLSGDLLDGVAEVFLMVQIDVRDDGDAKIQGVGRIEPPTESDFADQSVNPRREVRERHHREHLELCRLAHLASDCVQRWLEVQQRFDEIALADRSAIDLDALRVLVQIRLGTEAYPLTSLPKNR